MKRMFAVCNLLCILRLAAFAQASNQSVSPLRWTFTGYLEGVTSYHGPDFGDWFQRNPGARLVLQLNRISDNQTIYVGTWSGVGRYFNNETDFNIGLLQNVGKFKLGGEAAYYAVLGGDIYRIAGTFALPPIDIKGRKISITSQYVHFGKISNTSPYGGELIKVMINYTKPIGEPTDQRRWSINHLMQFRGDDNPFGLGRKGVRDWSGVVLYTLSVGKLINDTLRFDITGTISEPFIGIDSTHRGFRHSAGVKFSWSVPLSK